MPWCRLAQHQTMIRYSRQEAAVAYPVFVTLGRLCTPPSYCVQTPLGEIVRQTPPLRAGARRPGSTPRRRASSPACGVRTVGAIRSKGSRSKSASASITAGSCRRSSSSRTQQLVVLTATETWPEGDSAARSAARTIVSQAPASLQPIFTPPPSASAAGKPRSGILSVTYPHRAPARPSPRCWSSPAGRPRRVPSPKEYFVSFAPRRGTIVGALASRVDAQSVGAASPMSATTTRRNEAPRERRRSLLALRRVERHGEICVDNRAGDLPQLDASTRPTGRSTATTGQGVALMRSMGSRRPPFAARRESQSLSNALMPPS